MPAVSQAQGRLMGACEHGADWASCPKHMTRQQMHDFAVTPRKDLPVHVTPRRQLSQGQRALRDRSTRGSPPFSLPEFKAGYRRLG